MNTELIRCLKAGILSGVIIGIIFGVVGALFLYSSFLSMQSAMPPNDSIGGIDVMTHENFLKELTFSGIIGTLIQMPISCLVVSIIISVLLSLLKSKLTYTKVIIAYLLTFGIISFPLFQKGFLAATYLGESGVSLVLSGIFIILIFSLPGSVLFYYFWKKFGTKKPKNHDESKIKE